MLRQIKKLAKEILLVPKVVFIYFQKKLHPDSVIVVKACVKSRFKGVAHENWGDDINYYFLGELTGKKVLICPDIKFANLLKIENYLCIGSIISFYRMENSIVWGSGLGNDVLFQKVKSMPKKILAVRGPLTRKWLLNQGIDCPEVYGDPALLLPEFYKPRTEKKYRIGIIPHVSDSEDKNLRRLSQCEGATLISMSDYKEWKEVLDRVNECDVIVSSSLHGLIVAEAYGIPSVWIECKQYQDGWEFKYHDFYASIGKSDMNYIRITDNTEMGDLIKVASEWKMADINLKPLLDACPFDIAKGV